LFAALGGGGCTSAEDDGGAVDEEMDRKRLEKGALGRSDMVVSYGLAE